MWFRMRDLSIQKPVESKTRTASEGGWAGRGGAGWCGTGQCGAGQGMAGPDWLHSVSLDELDDRILGSSISKNKSTS